MKSSAAKIGRGYTFTVKQNHVNTESELQIPIDSVTIDIVQMTRTYIEDEDKFVGVTEIHLNNILSCLLNYITCIAFILFMTKCISICNATAAVNGCGGGNKKLVLLILLSCGKRTMGSSNNIHVFW